ncbi:MAG: hypothetical protein HY683_10390 [Chloroflexi bacterium]|nr:hypothetical protein [Chloroflexota bacterium]
MQLSLWPKAMLLQDVSPQQAGAAYRDLLRALPHVRGGAPPEAVKLFDQAMRLHLKLLATACQETRLSDQQRAVLALATRAFNLCLALRTLALSGLWTEALVLEQSVYENTLEALRLARDANATARWLGRASGRHVTPPGGAAGERPPTALEARLQRWRRSLAPLAAPTRRASEARTLPDGRRRQTTDLGQRSAIGSLPPSHTAGLLLGRAVWVVLGSAHALEACGAIEAQSIRGTLTRLKREGRLLEHRLKRGHLGR